MPKNILLEDNIDQIDMPENLAIGLMVARQREKCSTLGCSFDYYGFAFGQSPFPAPPSLSEALGKTAVKNGYADAEGIYELRKAAADFNARHFGLTDDPEQIIIGPGTKGLLFLLFSIITGDIIIPVPSWIGYAPQVRFLGKKHHALTTKPENNYKLSALELENFLTSLDKKQHILILNNPNNPTGQVYSKEELTAIAEVCRKHGIVVFSDEIYALTTFKIYDFTSMGTIYPEGTFVLNGLSKDRSAGGYRLGVCHLPDTDCRKMREGLKKLAATIYTNLSTPIQFAAVVAYRQNKDIDQYLAVTREIHRIMGHALYDLFSGIDDLKITKPDGGFYFYVDFNNLKKYLKKSGVKTSNDLSKALLSHPNHIAAVTGDALLLPEDNFGARIAYVDYQGQKAYDDFLSAYPQNREEEIAFAKKHAPLMIEGAEAVAKFVTALKQGFFKMEP